ncbi:sphingomyelin phosphodiesterase [Acanthopleuribacter pedis]|uniref:Sphingomyelin phosphodiesterase n=1 Tax=Acanthopleuribacter pedis TaxID=442870 RepID=A0A8J7Q4R9_9BACT|nr:sphingomyelin phosphodiesterase [Acanthopleuribacter pedis]MBO1318072.1 sphingomyelin phosphodiesterase [Acanthopleuribacter pedis]
MVALRFLSISVLTALFKTTLFLVFWFPAPVVVQAETYVYLQNDTPEPLTLEVSVNGGLSKGRHWNQTVVRLEPWQKSTPYLWFNRDEGITWRRTFYFETRVFQSGRLIATLHQKLRGNWIGSSLSHTADGLGWHGDRAVHQSQSSSGILTSFKSAYTGWYDDLVYVVHQQNVYDDLRGLAGSVDELSLLAYNLQLLPTSISNTDQRLRARHVAEALAGFDVIVFSEAFADDVRGFDEQGDLSDGNSLWQLVRALYPYRTDIVGKDEGLEQDGGVFIVSRWPIITWNDLVYDESVCAASDCLSEKGVMYAAVEKQVGSQSRVYHVFGSHLQADYDNDNNSHVRRSQFDEMRRFIDQQAIADDEPVILAGDFNVDRDTGEYADMLNRLEANDYETENHGVAYSLDGRTNSFAAGATPQLLDYVLVDKLGPQPSYGETAVLVLRSSAPAMMATSEGQRRQDMDVMGNYSDHYPVFAYFDFSN